MPVNAKNILIVLIPIVFSTTGCAGKQVYIERKQLFDHAWKFALEDSPDASGIDFEDTGWRILDLPHDWSIEGRPEPDNPTDNAGGYFPAGTGWYRKSFTPDPDWKGKHVSIYFEGVYMNAEVFLNGKSLGFHPYGYTSFYYDLTPYLDFIGENLIAVRVDNSRHLNSRWYSGSGIYRHVWLIVKDPVHIKLWGTAITTPEVSPENAIVKIKTIVENETADPQNILLSTQLMDENNKQAGNHEVRLEIDANTEKEVVQTISVENPLLWSPENPYLYEALINVLQGERILDISKNSFGIRTIEFSPENGFQLNGQPVIFNGGCVHHDNGCLGAAAYDRAEVRKVELLKSAGFNAVRSAHNPPSEAFLNACDSLGLLVIDESFDCWKESKNTYDYSMYFNEWWQRDIESMVLRDLNHPSIIIWSIGNEIIERTSQDAVETARMLADYVRELDPTRPVTSAMTTWNQGWEIFDPLFAQHDIGGYNYQLHYARSDHERVPSRIILQTESYPKDAFYCWDMVQNHSYIIGDLVWTAMDYLGESGIGRYYYPGEPDGEHWERRFYPWHGAYCGDIDLTGWRKPISHYRNILYNSTENLYMAVREPNPADGEIRLTSWAVWPTWESWTWPGYEGKEIQVEVYSKYPRVQLYLDNNLIGVKSISRDVEYKATFTLPYKPGILKAVSLQDNTEMDSVTLQTAGNAARIKLVADRTEILANGQDLSFVNVEIKDINGIHQPNSENELHFSVDGPGVIVGVDNANLKDPAPYVGTVRNAWHGRALVVIKSTHEKGDIRLTVSSPGLSDASLTLKSLSNSGSLQRSKQICLCIRDLKLKSF